jgi:hypothetical protein
VLRASQQFLMVLLLKEGVVSASKEEMLLVQMMIKNYINLIYQRLKTIISFLMPLKS